MITLFSLHKYSHQRNSKSMQSVLQSSHMSVILSVNDIKSHEITYQCSQCDMAFSSNKYKMAQTGERVHHCSQINNNDSRNIDLMMHMETNNVDKSYQCSYCNRIFSSNSHLINHLRIHTGEKPFECNMCNKGFTLKGNLIRHQMTHSNEKHINAAFVIRLSHRKLFFWPIGRHMMERKHINAAIVIRHSSRIIILLVI